MNRYRNVTLSLALILMSCAALAPPSAPAGDEWLPISQDDLAMKDNPASPGSNAMILYREDKIDATQGTEDEYFRVKIFSLTQAKDGTDQTGVVRITFNPNVRIEYVRGRTIEPDGRIVKFEGKIADASGTRPDGTKFFVKTFTLPEVNPGCILEYRYRQQRDAKYYWGDEWTIQGDAYLRLGRFSILPSTDLRAPKRLFYREFGLPANVKPVQKPNGAYELEIHDLPGIEKEDLMPPDRALRARVSFFYRDISAGIDESADSYWKRMVKTWNEELDAFVNKQSLLHAEVARVTSPDDSPEAKLRKLAARVQEIRDLSYERTKTEAERKEEGIKPNLNVEDVLKHGYASGKQINCLFVGLARAAGFEATEVYLAPRAQSEFTPETQDARQLTADIVWVRAGEKEMFLDPASKFVPFGWLPWVETASKGIKVSKKEPEFVSTPMPTSEEATATRTVDLILTDDGTATGKIKVNYTGYRAAGWRQDLRDYEEAGRSKKFEDEFRGLMPAGATVEVTSITNWDKVGEDLLVEGTFKIPNLGSPVGQRMLVPEAIFRVPYAKSFLPIKRVNMIYFRFPFEYTDSLQFHAPNGFKVETTPVSRKFDRGAVSYEIASSEAGDMVEVKRYMAVKNFIFPVEHYAALRAFFSGVKESDEAQIVLQNPETAKNQ